MCVAAAALSIANHCHRHVPSQFCSLLCLGVLQKNSSLTSHVDLGG